MPHAARPAIHRAEAGERVLRGGQVRLFASLADWSCPICHEDGDEPRAYLKCGHVSAGGLGRVPSRRERWGRRGDGDSTDAGQHRKASHVSA